MADSTDTPEPPVWLTRREAANRLRVSLDTIDRGIADGTLPVKRIGRIVRIAAPDVDAWTGPR